MWRNVYFMTCSTCKESVRIGSLGVPQDIDSMLHICLRARINQKRAAFKKEAYHIGRRNHYLRHKDAYRRANERWLERNREKHRAACRRIYQRNKADPVKHEAMKEYFRLRQRRLMLDPVYAEKFRAYHRERYRLRRINQIVKKVL